MVQNPPSPPVSRRTRSNLDNSSELAGAEAIAAVRASPPNPPQRLIKRIVPSSAAANTAKGAIHATRLNPCAGGAASTVKPYLPEKSSRICLSLSPAAISVVSIDISSPRSGQPTWSHSPTSCAQPHWHISLWPKSLNRDPASVAPSEKQTATAISSPCTALIQEFQRNGEAISRRL